MNSHNTVDQLTGRDLDPRGHKHWKNWAKNNKVKIPSNFLKIKPTEFFKFFAKTLENPKIFLILTLGDNARAQSSILTHAPHKHSTAFLWIP